MYSFIELSVGALLACVLLIPLVYTYTQWEIKHRIDLSEVFQRLNGSLGRGAWPRVEPGTVPLGHGRDKFGVPKCRLLTGEEGTVGVVSIIYWDNRDEDGEEVCDIHVFGKQSDIIAIFTNNKISYIIHNHIPVFEVDHRTTYLLNLILGLTRRIAREAVLNQP